MAWYRDPGLIRQGCLIDVRSGSVQAVQLSNITANGIPSLVKVFGTGSVNAIQATGVRLEGSAASDRCFDISAGVTNELAVSNYSSGAPVFAGASTVMLNGLHGDAFRGFGNDLLDTFVGTGNLTGHVPNAGGNGGWQVTSGTFTLTPVGGINAAQSSASNGSAASVNFGGSGYNGVYQVLLQLAPNTGAQLILRSNGGNTSFVAVNIDAAHISIYDISGSATLVKQVNVPSPFPNGTWLSATVIFIGTTILASVNGVQASASVSNTNSANSFFGIGAYGAGTGVSFAALRVSTS